MLLVNLNLRAVAAGDKDSLVERQLKAILRPEDLGTLRAVRVQAPLSDKAQRRHLRDPISGPAVRARIRRLFEVVHLRRRAHVTIRDLRSRSIVAPVPGPWMRRHRESLEEQRTSASETGATLYYYPRHSPNEVANKRHVEDRLVRLLRQADVGLVNDPMLDAVWITMLTRLSRG